VSFSLRLTGNHGAALITRYPTYVEDAVSLGTMEDYAEQHGESWVQFASDNGFGDVRPVLVSGFDMTRDYAMLAYSDDGVSLGSGLPAAVQFTPAIKVTRRTGCAPHLKCGPGPWDLSPIEQAIGFPSQSANPMVTPNGFNQCVFIRYYTMRQRSWLYRMFRTILPVVQYGAEATTSSGSDSGEEPTLTTDNDIDSEQDTARDSVSEQDTACDSVSEQDTAYDGGSEPDPTTDNIGSKLVWSLCVLSLPL